MTAALAALQESTVPLYDRWHDGERKVQDLLHVREAVTRGSTYFRPYLTVQMQEFVPGLNYFFIGTLDSQGRPWVSILTGPKGFMQAPLDGNGKVLEIKTRLGQSLVTDEYEHEHEHEHEHKKGAIKEKDPSVTMPADPIFSNFIHGETFSSNKRMWGGVALDFSNRRRNKMNGVLYPHNILAADENSGDLHVRLTVEQTIGNCPKYITVRELDLFPSHLHTKSNDTVEYEPTKKSLNTNRNINTSEAQSLPLPLSLSSYGWLLPEEQAIIRQADCLFIASRFIDETLSDQTSGMDCNHRGGNPGFVRILEDNRLVFPDYSGNRFFNTLGNIANDDRVGLLFLDFETGDTLHLTGHAKIFIGMASQEIYPRSQRSIQITVDPYHILRRHALPFRMTVKELSPYNPIIPSTQHRIVYQNSSSTLGNLGQEQEQEGKKGQEVMVTLTGIKRHTADISTFEFRTSRPIHYIPGQYAVLDFSAYNTIGYRHMAPDDPSSLNDDYIRTWTISSAPFVSSSSPASSFSTSSTSSHGWEESSSFSMTIKRKPDGKISNLLHALNPDSLISEPFTVPLISTGGNFFLPPGPYVKTPLTSPSSSLVSSSSSPSNAFKTVKLAFFSGGIGSTPFISMIRGIRKRQLLSSYYKDVHNNDSNFQELFDIQWITSVPYFEDLLPEILYDLVKEQEQEQEQEEKNIKPNQPLTSLQLSVNAFLTREEQKTVAAYLNDHGIKNQSTKSNSSSNKIELHFKRLDIQALLEAIPDLVEDQERQILLCGPEPYLEAVRGYLHQLGIPAGRVLTEEFNF
ncbi:hypothetical protein BX616_002229 [Lobosporangium transversale]|uniref:FAD-binding FR-type domain-containing protein n=1 Tax=Lobosporangium transversale TaxID=64571 RepID=A0A1Y2GN79_9FUNG|nr:hypothetical protein BCR41DRAFT_106296 [Lobosporangium transversale]KAF9901525.1 hypothetical protein BX616_002229 [Lobosporangium transversale]ORZ12188.1 hypothetical protein BCR41DRAFT_106296 [Lobosporangium transversale]|eukprot:XP_021880053.1 hypothetical protein BCR41DRAFT_106296 [Lobosporangium transversale]